MHVPHSSSEGSRNVSLSLIPAPQRPCASAAARRGALRRPGLGRRRGRRREPRRAGRGRPWVSATAGAAWLLLAAAAVAATLAVRRERAAADAAGAELRTLRSRADGLTADASHLVNVTLPSLVKRLRDGEAPDDALATATPPKDPQLRRVLHAFGVETGASEQRARGSAANAARAVRQLALAADGVDRLTAVTLPSAVAHLRRGASAETVLGELELPADPRLRVLADSVVRDLATGERRAAAAQEASAKALSRVQAKAVSMLADLREMQDRYGEEVFGDLLRLDHNTAQLGLLTDRLALLMGGRASRAWNRPIPMESILRGAVGRIASYQRVRLHSSSTAAVVGFAAEGVMHLLAELMDNATTFSPPSTRCTSTWRSALPGSWSPSRTAA
ncbi:hypothetical protein ACFQ60_11565 [Streptomyces zhihengii]